MRALVKKERKAGLWMEEAPVPEIGPQDVLIKVRRSAICGCPNAAFTIGGPGTFTGSRPGCW